MTTNRSESGDSNGANPSASLVPHEEVNRPANGVVNPSGQNVNPDSSVTVREDPGVDASEAARFIAEVFGNASGHIEIASFLKDEPRPLCAFRRMGEVIERADGPYTVTPQTWAESVAFSDRRGLDPKRRPNPSDADLVPVDAWYLRMTTLAAEPVGFRRGGKTNVREFVGFWLDGDYAVAGHHKNDDKDGGIPLPPDPETVRSIWRASGYPEPSIEWHTGGGINALWLLEQPVVIADGEDGKAAYTELSKASERWHDRARRTALSMGWHHDSVPNLDRLMRLPGSVNRKVWTDPKPVTATYSGKRYRLDDLMLRVPEPIEMPDGTVIDAMSGEVIAEAKPVVIPRGRTASGDPSSLTPWDDFDNRGDWWGDVLSPLGWSHFGWAGQTEGLTRPGKNPRDGQSATLNHDGTDKLYIFSTSVPATHPSSEPYIEKYLSKSQVWCHMVHGGDWKACAAELRSRGYGSDFTSAQIPSAPVAELFVGQLAEDGTVVAGTPLAEAIAEINAPSANWGGMIEPPLSEAELSAPIPRQAAGDRGSGGNDGGDGEGGGPDDGDAYALPMVDISNERDGLHNLVKEIANGALPETYVRDGQLVHVGIVSGARNGRRKKEGSAIERIAPNMTASRLRALIAKHMITVSFGDKGPKAKLPTEALCKAVLSMTEWETLPDLVEITRMPFVRPDGSVCQTRGYDEDTGTWLNVDDGFPEVPEAPSADEVTEAKDLLLSQVLGDFPFVSPGDRANYMGLLLAPALKQVIDGLFPFGLITAANAGSGKSLLAEIISRTYGGNGETNTLSRQDEEVRKTITSKLMSDPHMVVTFDNIGKTHAVESPVLAQLLTSSVWADRALGGNDIVSRVNDKLWLGTGNNVRLGGDMASRSVFVRIDPKMEKPDRRDTSRFVLGDLKTWLAVQENQIRVVHALLVLIRAWAHAGMPRAKVEMRTFSSWAQTVGGLLNFHGIEGFLGNTEDVDDADDEAYEWAQFFAAWHARHGDEWMTTAQLLASYKATQFDMMSGAIDPWNGSFPVKENGQLYVASALGAKFRYILDRPMHGWVLRRMVHTTTNQRMWRPEPASRAEKPVYEQTVMAAEGN